MDLSIIIVNFNTKTLLKKCLSSIFRETKGISFEVIVIDNGSTDGSIEEIKKTKLKIENLSLIENKENLGFAKANNQGIRKAKGEYILLLNSDTEIVDNALQKMIGFARTKPNLGVVGPRLLNEDGSFQPSTAPFFALFQVFLWLLTGDRFLFSSPAETCQVDWVMGSALLASRPAIKKAKLLDEKFFMYMEEVEWCYRIKKAGFENWFYPEAEIYHLVRGSSPEGKQKAIWWIYQGLVLFYQKHFASWQTPVLKFLLRTKAAGAWFIGVLKGDNYLKETYGKAFKLV